MQCSHAMIQHQYYHTIIARRIQARRRHIDRKGVRTMQNNIVLGIDGGGTYTRVAVADADGRLLSYVEHKGAASVHKDANAKQNVCHAVHTAVEQAHRTLDDVAAVVAGVAGYDDEEDEAWVRSLTDIDGLACASQHVNDAVIAHRGALLSQPGIISISGTGSIIFGITEDGQHVRNYNFNHYAATAARFLSYDCIHRIIAGETDDTDAQLIRQAFAHFAVDDVSELTRLGMAGFAQGRHDQIKLLGDFGPIVTGAASAGSQLAARVCARAAGDLVTGVRLLGACFASDRVSVAFMGSVAGSPFIHRALRDVFAHSMNKLYRIVEPALPAVLGAVMMALQMHTQTDASDMPPQTLGNLRKAAAVVSAQ